MSDQPAELTGPDFAEGIELTELTEGQPLLGHAGGEPVLLTRIGDEVFATAAHCTHYGAPLVDGLASGEHLVCPWHHACFSLRSGEALAAPALDAIACYQVIRDGSRLRVGDRLGEPTRRQARRSPAAIVIVGAGAAGAAAVESLRREGYDGPLTLVGAEAPGPVDRPNLSKDYLAGNAEEAWIPLREAPFYAALGVEFLPEDPVQTLDLPGRQARLQSGRTLPWEALLIATGSEAIRLQLPGADRPHVHTLRTLADSRAIVARADQGKRAVVIGASFIGLEVAASLRARGVEVAIVAPDALPLARILGDEVGRFVQGLHQAQGVRFHLGRKPAAIHDGRVELDDGTMLEADLVVMGVGVRPRTALAQAAGLPVDRGLLVDAQLRAAPGVFAAGDVARYPDPYSGEQVRIEHWVVAERMGQAAARNMLGANEAFRDVPFFWSVHYDTTLNYVGHAQAWDRIEVVGDLDARDALLAYRQGGRVRAVLTVGRDRAALEAEAAIARGDEAALEAIVRG